MAKLSSSERKDFALPSEKKYPIPDISHARNALSRVAQSNTAGEESTVRRAVLAKYPSLKGQGNGKKKKRLQSWKKD